MKGKVRPKKHLGQHFLTDLSIAQKIADSLTADKRRETIEVGPGMGVLTNFLVKRKDIDLYAAEIDKESIEYLNKNLSEIKDRIIEGDFLRMNLREEFPDGVNIIGNFPYNISSQIFFKILDNKDIIPEVVGMVQKEVAVRITNPPRSKEYGILSVMLQAFYDVEYIFTVDENVFNPPPKVKSGVIRLIRNSTESLECSEKLFFRIVKSTFNQRRKTIRNSFRAAFPQIEDEHPLFGERPERLSVKEFAELTKWTEERLPVIHP